MFDLITGKEQHIPGGGTGPVLVSSVLHVLGIGVVVALPLMFLTDTLPEVPTMVALVATAPAPPPPPPPPPPPAAPAVKPAVATRTDTPITASATPIPLEAPESVEPEPAATFLDEGVEGGVEGGVPGGVVGGVIGSIEDEAPPPPPAALPSGPVRIGGQIQPPRLVTRVEPVYPNLAVAARVQGTVILEATVSREGMVQDVKVLRSIPLLDRAAVDAVLQWRYSPVILNGTPVPFILTVVVSFSHPDVRATAKY
jgi:protein TonB